MKGGIVTAVAEATTLDEFANMVLRRVDRPVIAKTGIAGKFDFHLEYEGQSMKTVMEELAQYLRG